MILGDLADRLAPDKLKRLKEIRSAYPHTPLEKLPGNVMKEIFLILHSATKAEPRTDTQSTREDVSNRPVFTDLPQPGSIGTDLENGNHIVIDQKDRQQGLYIIGTTGTGKSTLIANLILSDIKQGLGVCLIEPHGDLTKTVLSRIPDERVKDVILLDLMDSEYPFGLNIFECRNPKDINEVAKTTSFVYHVFEKMWGIGKHTPRLEQVLRNVTQTLIENPGTTFGEIPLLFWNDRAREQLVGNVKNEHTRMFWERYAQKSRRDREQYVESTDNKVDAYLGNDKIRYIVSQAKTTIDFRKVMDNGKILMVLLSPQLEEISRLVGAVIIGKLLMAAYSRDDTPEGSRQHFNIYCDEYQRFATTDFPGLIQETGRKYRAPVTLAHQTLSQLDEANKGAAAGAANMIVLRVTGEDGKVLAKNFDTTPTQVVVGEEPIRAPISDVIGHLVKRGHNDARVTRFAQRYLQNLESLIEKKHDIYTVQSDIQAVTGRDILKGRELLNDCLYRCMHEKSAYFLIPPLALYILAIAQQDGSDEIIARSAKFTWEFTPPVYLKGFKETAAVFSDPYFISDDCEADFISHLTKKDQGIGKAVINMIRQLRDTMDALADCPIMVDTGQYKPRSQPRQYSDMENEIADKLTQQPNFQAKVKVPRAEYDIRTQEAPQDRSRHVLSERIIHIKTRMRAQECCKSYLDVEKEIMERQKKWKDGGGDKPRPGGPPPSFT